MIDDPCWLVQRKKNDLAIESDRELLNRVRAETKKTAQAIKEGEKRLATAVTPELTTVYQRHLRENSEKLQRLQSQAEQLSGR